MLKGRGGGFTYLQLRKKKLIEKIYKGMEGITNAEVPTETAHLVVKLFGFENSPMKMDLVFSGPGS